MLSLYLGVFIYVHVIFTNNIMQLAIVNVSAKDTYSYIPCLIFQHAILFPRLFSCCYRQHYPTDPQKINDDDIYEVSKNKAAEDTVPQDGTPEDKALQNIAGISKTMTTVAKVQ